MDRAPPKEAIASRTASPSPHALRAQVAGSCLRSARRARRSPVPSTDGIEVQVGADFREVAVDLGAHGATPGRPPVSERGSWRSRSSATSPACAASGPCPWRHDVVAALGPARHPAPLPPHQPVGLELAQRGVHRSLAETEIPPAAAADLADQLVTVGRAALIDEEEQQRVGVSRAGGRRRSSGGLPWGGTSSSANWLKRTTAHPVRQGAGATPGERLPQRPPEGVSSGTEPQNE